MNAIRGILSRIYEIRGERVMLDRDLAALYETETKVLNLAVKRNLKRFPTDFMFQLSKQEWIDLERQNESLGNSNLLRFHFETSKGRGGTRYLPFAFTEQGVAMLSGILNSDKAIKMNIAIMRAFVEVKKTLMHHKGLKAQLKEIKEKLGEHDAQLSHLYEAIENLLDEHAVEKKWDSRKKIGYT